MNEPGKPHLKGGCSCGAIRYTCDSPAGFSFHCQCRDCQRATGTAHSSAFITDANATKIEGDITWYERTAPSGNTVKQGFCGTCGSPLLNHNSGHASKLFINAGSLDDPELFNPTKVIYRQSALSWDFRDPEADGET